jgi:hypothetical protein
MPSRNYRFLNGHISATWHHSHTRHFLHIYRSLINTCISLKFAAISIRRFLLQLGGIQFGAFYASKPVTEEGMRGPGRTVDRPPGSILARDTKSAALNTSFQFLKYW